MKICFKCEVEKPLDQFYRHKQMADGHLNKCIECAKKDVHLHRRMNLGKVRAYDRVRGCLAHRKANSVIQTAMQRKNVSGYAAAHSAVARAVRSGRLVRPKECSCCGNVKRLHAHHDSYAKKNWLVVDWVCAVCHKAKHV